MARRERPSGPKRRRTRQPPAGPPFVRFKVLPGRTVEESYDLIHEWLTSVGAKRIGGEPPQRIEGTLRPRGWQWLVGTNFTKRLTFELAKNVRGTAVVVRITVPFHALPSFAFDRTALHPSFEWTLDGLWRKAGFASEVVPSPPGGGTWEEALQTARRRSNRFAGALAGIVFAGLLVVVPGVWGPRPLLLQPAGQVIPHMLLLLTVAVIYGLLTESARQEEAKRQLARQAGRQP